VFVFKHDAIGFWYKHFNYINPAPSYRNLHPTLQLHSKFTLESYIERSFLVTLMYVSYYKSRTAANNTKVSVYYKFHWYDETREPETLSH
jgi:hypothetical protein